METSTKIKTKVGRRDPAGGDDAEGAARRWLGRRLGWERRLAQLRGEAARRHPEKVVD